MVDQRRFLEKARMGVRKALVSRDNILFHTVASIDDINKTANLLFERLVEWYGVYFPELKISEADTFCKFVVAFDKDAPSEAAIRSIVGDKAPFIIDKAKSSMGMKTSQTDLDEMKNMARQILSLYELRAELETYQQGLVSEIAPNLAYLLEPALAAKMIAAAGGLDRLALMPSSTVQVLGAEKALFKHLRSGSPPPKHGLIFQHAYISASPKWTRGKIARALATKVAIAVKADRYTKNFIAEKLKATFEKRAKAVLAQKPPEGRSNNEVDTPRPRFERRERPRFERREERPRFGSDRPRFNDRPRDDRPRDDRPREGGDRPRFGSDRPRFGSDRPRFNDRPRDDRPREGGDRPRYNDRPRYGDRPRFNDRPRDDRPREGGDRPRFNDRPRDDRPREGGDRPREGGEKREGGRFGGKKPWENRGERSSKPFWKNRRR